MERKTFELNSLGYIDRRDDGIYVKLDDKYGPALKQLEFFTHVIVFWWAEKFDTEKYRNILQTNPPYAEDKLTGMFACRSPIRPNPVMITTCRIIEVDESKSEIKIENIDAFHETPVIDLKPYFPVCEKVMEAKIPEWLKEWPDEFPKGGLGMEG